MEKALLLEALEDERQELVEMLEGLPDAVMLQPGVVGDWSIRDTLAHLTFWEGQIVTLVFQVIQGVDKPTTVHFGQEPVDDLNKRWHEAGKTRELGRIWDDWIGVRKQTIRRVGELSEETLNNPHAFPWLEGVSLDQWVFNDTISHEAEHADQIREWLEARDEEIPGSNGHKP